MYPGGGKCPVMHETVCLETSYWSPAPLFLSCVCDGVEKLGAMELKIGRRRPLPVTRSAEFYEFKLPYPADNGRTAPRRAGGASDSREQVASLVHGGRTWCKLDFAFLCGRSEACITEY